MLQRPGLPDAPSGANPPFVSEFRRLYLIDGIGDRRQLLHDGLSHDER